MTDAGTSRRDGVMRYGPGTAVAAMLLAVAPFFALSAFAHPSADDYCSANQMRGMGLVGSFDWFWHHWTGRYVAAVTQNFIPIAFGSFSGYKLVAPALLIVAFLAIWWLVSELTIGWLRRSVALRASFGIFVVFLFGMPSVVEGLYWYTGVIIFTVGAVFLIATFAAALRSARSASRGAALGWLVIAILFDLFATGSNEPLILTLGVMQLFLAWRARVEHRQTLRVWLPLLIVTGVAGLVSITSPGNFARGTATGASTHGIGSIVGATAVMGLNVVEWITTAPAIIGGLLLLWSAVQHADDVPADSPWRRTPWVAAGAATLLAIWLSFAVTHWASGMTFRPGPPGRVLNELWLIFLIGGGVTLLMLGVQRASVIRTPFDSLGTARGWLILIFGVSIFGAGNVRDAYMELATGRAAEFNREMVARYERVRQSGGADTVAVAALTRPSKLLYFHDIMPDPDDWRNVCFANYWNVPKVVVQP